MRTDLGLEPTVTLPAGVATLSARARRQRAVAEVRRGSILDAARAAFAELGLEGASLREIAKRAGYTPGALYSYFDSKEAVYGALLAESLEQLNACVGSAMPAASAPASAVLRSTATAFFGFYLERPRDLELGFYIVGGLQPRGLTPALNDRLNERLRQALRPTEQALIGMGLGEPQARSEMTALFAHTAGVLLLSHTGRLRLFQQSPAALFSAYLDALLQRLGDAARTPERTGTRHSR